MWEWPSLGDLLLPQGVYWLLITVQLKQWLSAEAGPLPHQVLSLCSGSSPYIFPVMFPVMCSLIASQRPLDLRTVWILNKSFLFFYYLLLCWPQLEVKIQTIPTQHISIRISGKKILWPAPTHFFLTLSFLSISFSTFVFLKRSSLILKIKDNFFLLFSNVASTFSLCLQHFLTFIIILQIFLLAYSLPISFKNCKPHGAWDHMCLPHLFYPSV